MSYLIELQQPPASSYHTFKQQLRSLFKSKQFNCKNIVDQPFYMTYYLQASSFTYRLSTIWKFNFNEHQFSIHIVFYNKQQNDLLRAYTQRMKVQVSILNRMVNNKVIPHFAFCIDNQTGLFKMVYTVSSPMLFTMEIKRQNILYLVMNLFSQMKKYDQLMIFIQPTFNPKQVMLQKDPNKRINKFRTLLRGTKNTRKQIQGCFNDLVKFRQTNSQFSPQKINQISSLYLRNVTSFQKSTIGLEDINQYQFKFDAKTFASQLKEVKKNMTGYTTNQKHQQSLTNKTNSDKIISGLLKIQPLQNNQQQICSKQGAHSFVFRKNFKYSVVQTIYRGTIDFSNRQFMNNVKQNKGQLAYKICNTQNQTSINSFKNQIYALKFMKDMSSPFIARYYLQVKQNWNQKDRIYMNNYKKDVHSLLASGNKFSIKTKFQLAYKIAKGLCFLYSKQIVHRDFKPRNVVVDSKLSPKIIDFGSCVAHYQTDKFKVYDQRLLTTQGYNIQYLLIPPTHYQVRQKYTKNQYDQHPLFDVYGFGRSLSYIFFGDIVPPHPQSLLSQPMFQVLQHIIFLINMCTSIDPDDRPGFGELTAFLGSLNQLIKQDIIVNEDSQSETGIQTNNTYQ